MPEIERPEFKPQFVFIPSHAIPASGAVDPADCTLLMLADAGNSGWLYTKEQWEATPEERQESGPEWYRDHVRGKCHDENGNEPDGSIELIPEIWILKRDETAYWTDDVKSLAKRIFAVYALNRCKHVHYCEITPSYEMKFIGYDWEPIDGLTEEQHEQLCDDIDSGVVSEESFQASHVRDIEAGLKQSIPPHTLPTGKIGGYQFDSELVRDDDIFEQVQETFNTSTL